ncbi:MAG: hypothetical protein IJ833_07990, partial [Lachnospiraceae bacterium]|nr:hypothetical protein [Lachnospiraceae bacterium]
RERYLSREEGGKLNMCKGMDEWEAQAKSEGRKEGRKQGRSEGIEESRCDSIKALMETMKWSAEQAMEALQIPAAERKKYAARL